MALIHFDYLCIWLAPHHIHGSLGGIGNIRKKANVFNERSLFLAMETKEIISEIEKLTVKERLQIIEKTARTIQIDDEREQMKKAADQLYDDYKDDAELTAFTDLDLEDFYETR